MKKFTLRLLSYVISICLCITLFSGSVGLTTLADVTTNVWDGTDTYESLDALLTDLGTADTEGYYYIKTPNQLHAAIRFQGGGYKYKLDNDIYINENYEDYESWGKTAPANTWHFNQASNHDVSKMTPFTGTIDGCGYTIYGIFSNTSGYYNGLIGVTTGTVNIKNLNVKYGYLKASKRAGVIVGAARSGTLNVDNCSVRKIFLSDGTENNSVGGIVGLAFGATTKINNCAVTDVKFTSTISSSSSSNNHNPYAFGSFIGGIYTGTKAIAETGKLSTTQAKKYFIQNSYAVNVINVTKDALIYVCGIYYEGSAEKWTYSITANNVYTDATNIPTSTNTSPIVKLLVSSDSSKAIDPANENYPIKTITAQSIKGVNAKNAMPALNWSEWKMVENDYPYYGGKVFFEGAWDGKDSYTDLDTLLAELGEADTDGYYHISTPNQLHAVIRLQGGGYKYKLDNDIYINGDLENYENWGINNPANNWTFNQTTNWDLSKMSLFTGTIDGCGYTVYGLFCNDTSGYYNGLISATTGETVIKNLNVSHVYLNASKRAGVLVGTSRSGSLTIDGCSVSNVYIKGGGDNTPAGGMVGLSFGATTLINNSYTKNIKVTGTIGKSESATSYNPYAFGSFIGGIYTNMQYTINTSSLAKVQAKANIIKNSYAINVVNVTNGNTPIYVCGLFYENDVESWGYSITANNVYTDATTVSVSNLASPQVKLLVSTDGETIISPASADYPIKYIDSKAEIWDGKDSFENLESLLTELGETDTEGYYHIKTANQLHAVIRFQGGGNKYKLDNDIYLNIGFDNYKNWGKNAPSNIWAFNQASDWDSSKMTPFTGTIDGCGYTVYGLFSNTTENYNGLIGATTGTTAIKNLNIRYGYLNAASRAGTIIGCKRAGTLTIDGCSVNDIFLAGGWDNVPTGGVLGITFGGKTTISNCAVANLEFSNKNSINDAKKKENPYAYGSFIGGIYQSMNETGEVNHTQAVNNIIKNSYALNVKNVSNNNSPIYICGLYKKDGGWGRSITAIDVYTDSTVIPASQNIDPQVMLTVTIDGYNTNNTIKTPETDNFEGIFSNGLWYMGAFEDSLPIQKYKTADFTHLDITGEGIDDEYNALDLTYIRKNILGFKDYKHILGDLNGDGSITLKDLVKLKKIIVENNVTRPIPGNLTAEQKAEFTPTSVTVTLYDVNTNTYGITWNTKAEPFESVVQVSEGNVFDETNAVEFSASVQKYSTYDLDNTEYGYYVSKAEIKLEPNKTYTYRAIDKTLNIAGKIATLSTKSANVEKFTFVHVADSQVNPSSTADPSTTGYQFGQTLNAIKNSVADSSFLLHTGDIVEWSKYESYWENMLDYNSQYLMSNPLMAISGNHETSYRNGSNEIFKHFNYNIPEQADTAKGFFYTYDYGNARFIMLNTNRLSSNKLTQDQYNWLVNVLKTNTKKWTIVAMHNPMYSIGNYGSDPSKNSIALSLQEQLSELFAQYKVDLVLQGHDHAYSKTYPITSKGVIDTTHTKETINGITYDVNPKGTIYVMHGAAGNQSREPNANMNADLYDWYSRGQNNSWAEVTVENDMLTVVVKSASGGTTTTQKSYGIKK